MPAPFSHLAQAVEAAFHDIPGPVLAAMASGAAAALALIEQAWGLMAGQVPSPSEAGAWSFYGVLIVAIIVLFCSLASVIWWVASKGLQAFHDLTAAMNKVNDTLERQTDYFDTIARDAVRTALTNPPLYPK